MKNYVTISTFCNKEDIANKIIDCLLEKKLIAGSQISKVHSKYYWNNKIEECDEFKLEFRTKKNLFTKIAAEINKINDYEVSEISCVELVDGNATFFSWIDDNTKL